ncbi:3-ketoacyl-CoA synthase 20-like [Gastrolobium bilobum]|uniref:3-ketoacyl-CoA synthase 20-like n=1 Tax=Gastrolobium bilobum TaxID=150636 RepID=UPI002AAFEB7B|nr:3-ketoacyl-CoA synthase 20-like [Gastrolobium bilobum]
MNILFMSLLAVAAASIYAPDFYPHPSMIIAFCLTASLVYYFLISKPNKIYLVDFACYKPSISCLCTKEMLLDRAKHVGFLSEENVKLVTKIIDRSGLGPLTYVPEGLLEIPPKLTLDEARKETDTVLFGAVDELLEKTGVEAKDIGILVVNCCLFNPTPSLSDTIVNHYKLRGNILTYNLSGMGCSAGVLAVDFAKQLLQAHPNSYALVLSTENEISSMYWGNNPSMLLVNCLFRMGGSAALLSSHPSDCYRSKYQLIHTLRTHVGADDNSYKCVFQEEDADQKIGVSLSKDLMNVARDALKVHITSLGPVVLPISEKLKFLANLVERKLFKTKMEAYMPNFKLAFKHFCIHTGGRAVLDRMQKSLELDDWHMEPSRMTLYRFGNTSSSSVWYELAYCEAKGRIKKGDRIWQMAFGSGFKCNTAVWLALNTIEPASRKSPWRDEIDDFPIKVDQPMQSNK